MQIEHRLVIPQTDLYSEQRNWKQIVLRRNKRTQKLAKGIAYFELKQKIKPVVLQNFVAMC